MVSNPLEKLVKTIHPGGCHVVNLPSRIWVFGGPMAENSSEESRSLRDAFWRKQIGAYPVKKWFSLLDRPENHEGWWAFSGYDNLLEFERDACYLARLVVLFSESPGSHAELGALALDDSLIGRLFVVIQRQFLNGEKRQSFLNLGPLKRVELLGHKCVIASEHRSLSNEDFDAIVDSVDYIFSNIPHKREEFDPTNPTHKLLLIADLVDLFLVSKVGDLLLALAHFGVTLDENQLTKSLFLLDFLSLVKLEMRGIEQFWIRRSDTDAPWVDYTSVSNQPNFDRARFKVECKAWIDTDSRRLQMLQRKP